ncbi:MAG: ABC transporter ATP-binding protein [Deltaproteobacteria bacterium]|nr:ABC transporter ATP-binding protein [Deltaproteobacteria bacterium]
MTSIEISNLSKSFGSARVLANVSIKIASGEFCCLVGPSGCGKTTLLRLVAGFITGESGDILFDGKSVKDLPVADREIGFVFQNYALWPHMTAYQNVLFGLEARKVLKNERAPRAHAALTSVQMDLFRNRYPHELSGGQQQRVAIARALALKPKLLLLDEPLSNLDTKLREELRGVISDLQREHSITTIYVTHDQHDALVLADKLAVLSEGRIIQSGTPESVYESPLSAAVAGFIGSANFIQGEIVSITPLKVRCAFGVLDVASSISDAKIGHEVKLAIRPSYVSLTPTGECSNRLEGIVMENRYFGPTRRIVLESQAGALVAECPAEQAAHIQTGQKISIALPPHRLVALAA